MHQLNTPLDDLNATQTMDALNIALFGEIESSIFFPVKIERKSWILEKARKGSPMKRICICCLSIVSLSISAKAVIPNSLFSDHAILQRGAEVPVWGTAKDGETVTVQFAGQTVSAVAKDGRWKVQLQPMAANFTGRTMAITGENSLTINDVLVGDVWLCSGQSNMVKTIKAGPWCPYGGVLNADQESAGNYPSLRCHEEFKTGWSICGPDTLPKISAVAFFFGRELNAQLQVPIGLVIRASGGSAAESWTPENVLKNDSCFALQQARAKEEDAVLKLLADQDKKLEEDWKKEVATASAQGKTSPSRPVFTMTQAERDRYQDLGPQLTPSTLYPKIQNLIPMAFKGCIWYQGESNARRGDHYAHLLSLMIAGWRSDFGASFPFLIVQLPNYGGAVVNDPHQGCYPLVREAQMQVAQTIPGTGIVPTMDVGEAGEIHPGNKQPVGYRLAQVALKKVYGQDVIASGPRFASVAFNKGKAVVNFTKDSNGVVLKCSEGFQLAGPNHQWHPATAVIQGDTVEVTSPDVTTPIAVRYDYLNNAPATLFNLQGWPAFPFRSDNWD